MDFCGEDHAIRVRSLHPVLRSRWGAGGHRLPLVPAPTLATTAAPSHEQLELIRRLDPHGLRAQVIKGNPPGVRPKSPA
jgi:glutaconate CoA-transferase subunit B